MLEISLYKFVLRPFSLLTIFILFISSMAYAAEKEPISFGKVNIGDSRLKLRVKDFKIKLNLSRNIPSKVVLKKGSIQWIRVNDVLLTPRARLAIYFKGNASDFHIKYRNQSILMQQRKKLAVTQFYVSLFQFDKAKIYYKGKEIGKISFHAKENTISKRKTHLIDYSCSRNNIKIKGMDNEYISLGCRTQRVGKFGKEKPMTEILWSSANYKLLDNSEAPYIAVFMDSKPVKIKVKNQFNEVKEIEISARIPKRLHRLNVAYGLGPYAFNTTFARDPKDLEPNTFEVNEEPMAPAFMLYFNFKLSPETSVRGFNALVAKKSIFNNLGVYFASDLAKVSDNKLTITTLLGMQHLYFQFDSKSKIINEPIFPQGIEANYNHAFGIENYLVGGGAFLSPSESYDYQNIWVRWGKGIFWELNYIYWKKDEFSVKTWGLSAGFFFGGFL
jgi:hypothetical protein